jgi:hypothetical protein
MKRSYGDTGNMNKSEVRSQNSVVSRKSFILNSEFWLLTTYPISPSTIYQQEARS